MRAKGEWLHRKRERFFYAPFTRPADLGPPLLPVGLALVFWTTAERMRRPDQHNFDMLARHFEDIDCLVEAFCKTHDFQLERNYFRQPSRVLKREGNPSFLIDIGLSEHWLKTKYEEDMPHTITVIGYYEPPNSAVVWKLAREISSQERFSHLQGKLTDYLEKAACLINEWTSEVIMRDGKPSANVKRKYRTA